MKTTSTRTYLYLLLSTIAFLFSINKSYATHAQSADLTYECLGGNQYQINLSFYRDCAGVAAPNTVTIDITSVLCNQNLNLTLAQVPGTGVEVTPICQNMTTECSGGSNPGVQEWKYSGIITLPFQCMDWIFGFQLCCRNNAISTINTPGSENIYVEAHLDNENFPCNSSPSFSNPPIPFVCVGQNYCFNHGATDIDGDSLVYTLITPMTSPATTVTYLPGYSATQPVQSAPLMTFNSQNGDICMTPSLIEVTVMAVKVDEYRNGQLVGSVIRDIQLRTIPCSNDLPYITGINGTGQYQLTACAGLPVNFTIPSFDPNATQNVTLSWNNGISGASFTTSGGQFPTATFSWIPNSTQISNTPYCFTVTVSDDNCPYNGTQTFSFCITVTGFEINVTANNTNCGASNGSANVSVGGGNPPYTYNWSSGSTQNFETGLTVGNYTVTVTDISGCQVTEPFAIQNNSSPGNMNMSMISVSCFGGNDGAATANVNGGSQPYSYQWSNGATSATITGLSAGMYYITVTTADGCISSDSILVTQPLSPLSMTTTQTNVTCNGYADGSASVVVAGGSAPYYYTWSNGGNASTENNLTAGNYNVQIMDSEGCSLQNIFSITEPSAIVTDLAYLNNINCYGNNNGAVSVIAGGGVSPYTYNWNNGGTSNSISNLGAGTYDLIITDANGCTGNFSATITEPAPLTLSIIENNVTCYGANNGSAQVVASGGTGNYSYNWNTNPIQYTYAVSTLSGGNYTVTVTDANNCSASAIAVIYEPSPLSITVQGAGMICPGQFIPISVTATGGNGNYIYNWSNGLGNTSSQNVSPVYTTTYTVYVTDPLGCMSQSLPVTVTVNDINQAYVNVTGTPFICEGNSASVFAEIIGTGVYSYTWNNNLPATQGPHSVSPAAGTYYTVTMTDDCGNSIIESVYVDVETLPIVDISPQSLEACGSGELSFENNYNNGPNYNYNWTLGNGNTANGPQVFEYYNQSGNYTISLTMTSNNGCSNSDTTTATVLIHAIADAIINSDKIVGSVFDSEFRFYNLSVNSTSCFWDFGDGNTSTDDNPMHKYEEPGTYEVMLVAYNANGCDDTTYLTIIVNQEFTFYMPNAFTPDGDGINDTFFGKGTYISEYNLMIFDRWGELIFTTDNINNGWDGTYRGANAVPDVYVYKVNLKDHLDNPHKFEGHVTLVK